VGLIDYSLLGLHLWCLTPFWLSTIFQLYRGDLL